MKTDKEVKKEFKIVAQKSPEKYYPVEILKKLGFKRAKCPKCGTFYWSTASRKTCGDTACEGGFSFIGKSPAKKKLDYVQTWQDFSKIHKKMGYTPIARYPVVARWRDDTDFVQAGIYDFQPWVVSGEVKPPANPVTEPQFCLRFNDIDNVGVTGAHYVGFVMLVTALTVIFSFQQANAADSCNDLCGLYETESTYNDIYQRIKSYCTQGAPNRDIYNMTSHKRVSCSDIFTDTYKNQLQQSIVDHCKNTCEKLFN